MKSRPAKVHKVTDKKANNESRYKLFDATECEGPFPNFKKGSLIVWRTRNFETTRLGIITSIIGRWKDTIIARAYCQKENREFLVDLWYASLPVRNVGYDA